MTSPCTRTLYLFVAATLFTTTILLAAVLPENTHVMVLDHGWDFRQAALAQRGSTEMGSDRGRWRPAVLRGNIRLELVREKLIPDSFYRTYAARLQSISNEDWEDHTRIKVDTATLAQELLFDRLDSCATFTLNRYAILMANNMFRTWPGEIKPILHLGGNEFRVLVPSPGATALRIAQQDPWDSRTHTDPKTYVHKTAYEFGWTGACSCR